MNRASENDLDLVLAALRDTQPSAGFEQRLLATVEQGAELPLRRGWFWPLAAATAVVAICVGVVYHHAGRHTEMVVAVGPGAPVAPHVGADAVPSYAVAGAKLQVSPLRPAAFGRDDKYVAASVVGVPTLSAADQAALDNTMAPSQVAPPAPLTAGERMLLRSARRNDQVNMAQLEALPRFAAHDSEEESVAQFVRRNLASLAFAESFHPTVAPEPLPPPVDEPQAQPESPADTPQ